VAKVEVEEEGEEEAQEEVEGGQSPRLSYPNQRGYHTQKDTCLRQQK